MSSLQDSFTKYKGKSHKVKFYTLGKFITIIDKKKIDSSDWGRDKTLQLIQFFITQRHQFGIHKEVIIDRIWESDDMEQGNRDFKVALHGIRKILEPERKKRKEASFIDRQGMIYKLETNEIWVDSDAMDFYFALANQAMNHNSELVKKCLNEVIELYQGVYLPNRLYEDWSSAERERLQIQALNAYMLLSEMLVKDNPRESIRLAQLALLIDNTWEEAYRIQMMAYLNTGNRPQAIKTYNTCERVLDQEYGIPPLPETKQLIESIKNI